MKASSSRRRPPRRGASLVEFAFVAPVLFMLVMGVLEYSRFLFTIQLVNNAAREGARYAAVNTATLTTANIQSYVDQYMTAQGGAQLQNYTPANNITVFQADPVTGQSINTQ
jgi:Flp pilus assembly protein TadG